MPLTSLPNCWSIFPDGTSCNDNNSETINDIYTSGICSGKLTLSQTCSDNEMTSWTSSNYSGDLYVWKDKTINYYGRLYSNFGFRCVKSSLSYTCPSGGTLSGTTCTVNTLVTTAGTCSTGYTNSTLGKCVQN